MLNVFDYIDYKRFLGGIEAERASLQRGFRSRIAEVLDCQNAYVSQILNTHANFSLEQAFRISSFLGLNETETRYFILLVEYARAGTPALKELFKKDIDVVRDQHFDIATRVPKAQDLSPKIESIYFSNWLYATIHLLATIPNYRTISKISAALRIDQDLANEIVLFLVSSGLLVESKGELIPGPTQIHLSHESPNVRQHHATWRAAAVQSQVHTRGNNIHYSAVSSLSASDAEILKSKFVQLIEDYTQTIAPSKEEVLYNFNLDFYSLIKKQS